MIRELDYERSTTAPTTPLNSPRVRLDPYALDLLFVAVRMLLCLAAIAVGIWIAVNGPNEGVAALAAFACGGVVYGLLGRTKR